MQAYAAAANWRAKCLFEGQVVTDEEITPVLLHRGVVFLQHNVANWKLLLVIRVADELGSEVRVRRALIVGRGGNRL
jgi:hypothetical protein